MVSLASSGDIFSCVSSTGLQMCLPKRGERGPDLHGGGHQEARRSIRFRGDSWGAAGLFPVDVALIELTKGERKGKGMDVEVCLLESLLDFIGLNPGIS